jgi:hypothetical protein
MYTTVVKTSDIALCHLFLHCCFKDGQFTEAEIDEVSGKFVELGLNKDLNFKDQLHNYKLYRNTITDEANYIKFLIQLINPTNEAALYSYCIELGLSDSSFDFSEKKLMETLGTVLELNESEQSIIQKLMVQRKVVETQKFF